MGDEVVDATPDDVGDDGELNEEQEAVEGPEPPTTSVGVFGSMALGFASAEQQEAASRLVESRVEAGRAQVADITEHTRESQKLPVRSFEDISMIRKIDGEIPFVYWTVVSSNPKIPY